MIKTYLFLLFLLVLLPTNLSAFEVNLTWKPNKESDLAGYKVYFKKPSGDYIEIADKSSNSHYMIFDNWPDTLCVKLKAYDVWGNPSGFSEERCFGRSEAADFLKLKIR